MANDLGSRLLRGMNTTGRISNEIAKGLHVVGPAGRASGIDGDTRRDHPYAAYPEGDIRTDVNQIPDGYALGYTEAPRGETYATGGGVDSFISFDDYF